jgi:serine/threonine-protein phosphatase 2B catalytic subunit
MGVFDQLPICAIIDKSFFAVHGGISPHLSQVSNLQKISRTQEVPTKGLLCDLLWSDPLNDVGDKWRSNSMRQCSFYYGVYQSKAFLDSNNLKMIIRGHEVTDKGFKYQKFMRDLLTLTIFSAPNYADLYHNKGCIA